MRNVKRLTPPVLSAFLVRAAFTSVGCGVPPAEEGEQIDSTSQAWSVSSCGAATADSTFTGHVGTIVDTIPTFTSPRTYNNCFKSYVVDLNNLESAYAGLGAGIRSRASFAAFRRVRSSRPSPRA